MRILWVSNSAFTTTGYGVATHAVTQQMLKDGHEPHVLSYWGLVGAHMEVNGVWHHGPAADGWGNDYMESLAKHIQADFILIHRDIWVNDVGMGKRVPLAAWFPVDSSPFPAQIAEHVKHTKWPATMSRAGQRDAAAAGFAVDFLPHSYNPDHFFYSRDKAARAQLGVPQDAFLITIVGANKGFPSRKGYPEMLSAVAELQKMHPDVWCYIHSNVTTEAGGPNIQQTLKAAGADLTRCVLLAPFLFHYGIEADQLGSFYQASDVLLNTSYGEGFGIPILEAQACGTPVVTTNWTSMPELTWHGLAVEGELNMNPYYSYWKIPRVADIAAALDAIYRMRGDAEFIQDGKEIAANIRSAWTDEAVYKAHWKPYLAKIERELPMFRYQPGEYIRQDGSTYIRE